MGADLSMSPPPPPRYVVLVTERESSISMYRYDSMRDREWVRVFYISRMSGYQADTMDAVLNAFRAQETPECKVDTDAVMTATIDIQQMKHLRTPPPVPVYEPKHAGVQQ